MIDITPNSLTASEIDSVAPGLGYFSMAVSRLGKFKSFKEKPPTRVYARRIVLEGFV
jgi:hypothetical protein